MASVISACTVAWRPGLFHRICRSNASNSLVFRAGDILPGLPPALKTRLFEAFDLQILWNKPGRQATVHAEITDATLQALPGILNPGQDGYDVTSEEPSCDPAIVEDLFEAPIVHQSLHEARNLQDLFPGGHITTRLRITVRISNRTGTQRTVAVLIVREMRSAVLRDAGRVVLERKEGAGS